ncbi:MAG: hypothetical protein IK081_02040 [Lachnospiraceae bacterium]|nr:hypothetical protein [Lachnospiraceae bacterium]
MVISGWQICQPVKEELPPGRIAVTCETANLPVCEGGAAAGTDCGNLRDGKSASP